MVELETGGFKNLICSYIITGKKPLLVESGPTQSVPNLLAALNELSIAQEAVEYIAITHVHLDHGGGAGTLLKHLPNAKVIVHPKGLPHLMNPTRLWESAQTVLGPVSYMFGEPEPVPKERLIPMMDGVLDLGYGGQLKITETSGHASHNLSFLETFNRGVFPGDAAGTYTPQFDVVMPTTPPPFYLDEALASLDKIISLNPSALYYSHFGKASDAIKRLQDYKQQLKLWATITIDGVRKHQSMQQIGARIFEEDKVVNKIAGFLSAHPVYTITVLQNNLEGFIDYAQRIMANEKL